MRRRDLFDADLSHWPVVDSKSLPRVRRHLFERRVAAVEQYLAGMRLHDVQAKHRIDRHSIVRFVERALSPHPDGRLWGYRALVPYARVRAYQRIAPPRRQANEQSGNSGAFQQLLEQYPVLFDFLRDAITRREVHLAQVGDRMTVVGLNRLHERFMSRCREIGLTAADYPIFQRHKAKRSLSRTMRDWMLARFAGAALSGSSTGVKPASALRTSPDVGARLAYDTVEFDAHKLDIRLKVLDQDPFGQEQVFEIERIWLLAVIDVATRCVLGYHLCLEREYSRYDVIRTFENALSPATKPTLTIPELSLPRAGGFVSTQLPETACTCWRRMRFDNARAHLAADSLNVLCELLGSVADVGPVYTPDDRPFIERFFGTIARQLSHRLPGTTGSSPNDLAKALADPKGDLSLVVTLDELTELLAVTVWRYHGTPHEGLGGRTPLEAMTWQVRDQGILLRQLPEMLQRNLCLLQTPHRSRVRGNIARGEKPHISFYHVRYTSPRLASSPHLVGKDLRIYYSVEDIRTVRAFLADGSELGELSASGHWRTTPHSLAVRRKAVQARRLKELAWSELDDPVEVYLRYRRSQAKASRKAASEIARIKRQIARDRQKLQPISEAVTDAETPKQPESLPLAEAPVKARKLRIPPGYT